MRRSFWSVQTWPSHATARKENLFVCVYISMLMRQVSTKVCKGKQGHGKMQKKKKNKNLIINHGLLAGVGSLSDPNSKWWQWKFIIISCQLFFEKQNKKTRTNSVTKAFCFVIFFSFCFVWASQTHSQILLASIRSKKRENKKFRSIDAYICVSESVTLKRTWGRLSTGVAFLLFKFFYFILSFLPLSFFFFFLLLFGCFRLDIFFMLLLRAKRVKLRVFSKCTQQLLAPGSYIWKEIRGFPLSHEKKKNLFPPKMFLFWQEKERTSRSGSNHHTEYHR